MTLPLWSLWPMVRGSALFFPGNIIPASRFDPVAAATLKYFPAPNTTGNAITNQNNFIYSANSITNSDKYDVRSDMDFSESTRMFVRVSRQEDLRFCSRKLTAARRRWPEHVRPLHASRH